MGAHFLCCLPLRLGVLVISVVQFFLLGLFAAATWYSYWYQSHNAPDEMTTRFKVYTILHGIFYSIGAIMSIVGFIGVLRRRLNLIASFASMQWSYFFFLLVSTIINIVLRFTEPADAYLNSCLRHAETDDQKDICHKLFDNWKKPATIAIYIAISLVPLIIQLYGCYIVGAYSKKLQKEGVDRNIILTTSGGFKYQPAGTHDDSRPLTQPDVSYPYKDASHSYGNQSHA
ncbi:hypothetical protein ONZ45_g2536 [Pleurotus djamor]|nr:hypothetical protein ONZ45_g7190 [Pleurotus djamor]KAJ8520671.1 hypothetical protein ONZ45_g2536 [Pleurotus djamor]